MEAVFPLQDKVAASDVIVVGTMTNIRSAREFGFDKSSATIVVDSVLWGAVAPGDSLRVTWQNLTTIACPRVEFRHGAGHPMLWFLERDETGYLPVSTSQRCSPVGDADAARRFLRDCPWRLRTPEVGPAEPMRVTVVFRNCGLAPITVPRIAANNGIVRCGPGAELTVRFVPNGTPVWFG
ncbi:MAG TPA: hypothetical protein VFX92_00630, partial [Candidatus Krumholzibacteria bacterium]|nr:hypothetical protein [Candidatus Krumholzibacteria bacterium]